jgi:ATP-dependent RNA helicase DDX5/DBP2
LHQQVFCSSKRRCDALTKELRVDGWPALTIHGDKSQEERDWVLQQFKDGEQPLLIATDVAQRGLDIKGVAHVVNYDCPTTGEAYVHRIGRTGRAGSAGSAYTFVTPDDRRVAPELVKVLKGSGQPVPAELAQLAQEARAEARYRPNSRYQ